MKWYKIKAVSEMTGTTVRMLQFYDEIDLLKPKNRSASGYRLYTDADLLRLQQIMTLKYLGLSLADIKNIIQSPDFEILHSLKWQAEILSDHAVKIQETSSLLKYIASQIEAGEKINWKSTFVITNILEMNTMNDSITKKYAHTASGSELGKTTEYDQTYNPDRLYPIPRAGKRKEIGINPEATLPFHGFDCWNHYEVSWLNEKGKPIVAIAEIIYDCESPNIVESKSLKLYFNSFNQSKFKNEDEVQAIIQNDLTKAVESNVIVNIHPLTHTLHTNIKNHPDGECIDHLDVECHDYSVNTSFLSIEDKSVEETLYSDLLKSNCLVTNQPDWGTVQIHYRGKKINREGLLKYLISFRLHNEFHEQCIERIFMDIMTICKPESLTVNGRYTRRGGLDINPYRSTEKTTTKMVNQRLIRQ